MLDAETGRRVAELEELHAAGFFAGPLPGRREPFPYRLRFSAGDVTWEAEDPYRFPPVLGEMDVYLIAEGTHRRIYERLGAHPREIEGVDGVGFAVWAPNARRVSVVGDFNVWDGRRHPMRKRVEAGSGSSSSPACRAARSTNTRWSARNGQLLPLKADPVGFAQEHPPATASRVVGQPRHEWDDADWMAPAASARRSARRCRSTRSISARGGAATATAFSATTSSPTSSSPTSKDMGFTHIECCRSASIRSRGSWGYQPIGLFAPTSRFGTPDDFARFVDRCHQAGLGVLLDWVPAHFPTDAHGLARFDGTALYEHEDPRLGFHNDWNTLIYNFGRREVSNFLVANALFWLEQFHIDGLRVDAVASMLYLDYSREAGEWIPNVHGGRENLEAVAFLREMNRRVFGDDPGAITVAEESTAWPQVSRPVYGGGLGFGYKWNMGWMHDTLEYMRRTRSTAVPPPPDDVRPALRLH